jgi:hypothetical protein
MNSELKIIINENIHNVKVLLDDQPIGMIQEIKFRADVDGDIVTLELVFPDLTGYSTPLSAQLTETLIKLRSIPWVQVSLRPL